MSIATEMAGALSACIDQIHQMEGMFDDKDGTIQQALDAAEQAMKRFDAARAIKDDNNTQLHLARVLDMAREHIQDIEAGIEEGLYDADENTNLPQKQTSLAAVEAMYLDSMGSAPTGSDGLRPYVVVLYEGDEGAGEEFVHFGFECEAEDGDHAQEQAEDAYPRAEVKLVYETTDEDRRAYRDDPDYRDYVQCEWDNEAVPVAYVQFPNLKNLLRKLVLARAASERM